jgi:hypothetical protein
MTRETSSVEHRAKFYIFPNDIITLAEDFPFEYAKCKFILMAGHRVNREHVRPLPGDTEKAECGSRSIAVGKHGTVMIKLHPRADTILGEGKAKPRWIAVPVRLLAKSGGHTTGDSLFTTARIHGN